MDILFHKKFFMHNPFDAGEGAYRIQDFNRWEKDTEIDGEKFITLVHEEKYREFFKKCCHRHKMLAEVTTSPETYEAACLAVGAAIHASENNAFAVVRPPGHHARRNFAAGFCFLNNIAIATQKLVNEGKKVFILDIDGHHGDGTQSIFYTSPDVLYCSVHQVFAYPMSGYENEIGEGEGEGYTMNFPLLAGSGDRELLASVDKAIMKAEEFKPDVVGVSAGFDGYEKDMLLNLCYTLNGYYEVGFRLSRSFKNIFAVLEGGYHRDVRQCIEHFVEGVEKGK
ncbi:MAG: histone deacetylase [Bacteroidales bacterium]|nr:histone deacetylase [Bacteroidales bacterium]